MRGDTLQAENAAKTHCVNGHEFTPENTYAQRGIHRSCRICQRRRGRDTTPNIGTNATPPVTAVGSESVPDASPV